MPNSKMGKKEEKRKSEERDGLKEKKVVEGSAKEGTQLES